ncbi:MAG: M23 family metallopeptidase [Rikenellaceae bacterium]
MRKSFKYFLVVIATIFYVGVSNFSAYAQRSQTPAASLMAIAVDTLSSDKEGMRMVLYSNGTWKYIVDSGQMQLHNELVQNWDTTQIFAYKNIELKDLPDVIELDIVENLSQFHTPAKNVRISSKYGPRWGRNHNGIDLAAPQGTPIYATFDGRVRFAQYHTGGYGFMIIVRNVNGLESWHGHLCRLNVKSGDYVKSGQVIGYMGNTGRSYGNHLHYELRYRDQTFDPDFLIDFETGSLRYTKFTLEKSFFNIYSRASEILDNEAEDLTAASDKFAKATDEKLIEKAADAGATFNPSAALYHKVKSGDTLLAIARKYGTTTSAICRLNNISRNSILRLGQRLRIR